MNMNMNMDMNINMNMSINIYIADKPDHSRIIRSKNIAGAR